MCVCVCVVISSRQWIKGEQRGLPWLCNVPMCKLAMSILGLNNRCDKVRGVEQ